MKAAVVTAASVFALLAGCTTVQPRLGFEDVRAHLQDRVGVRAHWYSGSPEDEQVRSVVDALLSDEITVQEAVRIALLNNRELQALYEDLNISQADVVQAGLLRNPVLDAAVRWPTSGGGHTVDLGVAFGFLEVFWIPLRKERAQAEFEAAKLRVADGVLRTVEAVRIAYYDLAAAEQQAEVSETVLASMDASHELAKRLHAAGNIRDLDLSLERAAYEESKLALSRARSRSYQLREKLGELMGVWGKQTAWTITNRLGEPHGDFISGSEAEVAAVENSLELLATRKEAQALARGLGLTARERVFADAELGAVGERELEGHWSLGPAAALPIPIFDQGQAAQLRARAQLAAKLDRIHATAVRIRARARASAAAAHDAAERARYYREVLLPLRERITAEMQLQYNAMQVSPLALLEVRRQQARAGWEYIEALREYWVSRARLELLIAGGTADAADQDNSTITETRAGSGAGGH